MITCPESVQEPWPPGAENGKVPSKYSCLQNPMDSGAWPGNSPQGRKQSDNTEVTYMHSATFKMDDQQTIL